MTFTETEWVLSCAKFFFTKFHEKTIELNDRVFVSDEPKYLIFGFINASRCVTFYMEREFNHLPGFLEWYKPNVSKLNDAWVTLRNITQKEHSPRFSETLQLEHGLKEMIISPELTISEPYIELRNSFITLSDLDVSRSAVDLCKEYLTSLETFVEECLKIFGYPYNEKMG